MCGPLLARNRPAPAARSNGAAVEPSEAVAARLNAMAPTRDGARSLADLEGEAIAILKRVIHHDFAGRIALVSSFGAEAAVMLKLIAEVDRATPVIFLETGKHFTQTLQYRRRLAAELGLVDVRDVKPDSGLLAARDPDGALWRRNTDACCDLRKVRPLNDVLEGFDAWMTGRKRFHGGVRLGLPRFEAVDGKVKVNPLVDWRPADIAAFMARHELPPHPLVEHGFPSIGCWPCTRPAAGGEGARAGRWRGSDKSECGIHAAGVSQDLSNGRAGRGSRG